MESDAVLRHLVELEARIDAKLDRLAASLGRVPGAADDYTDIDPTRFYTVADLADSKRRPISRQSLYRALDSKRLRETCTAGVRGCMGSDYIAFLSAKSQRRRGSRANRAKV